MPVNMLARVSAAVRKHRAAKISHVIPFFQLCTNSKKSQNFNDPTSNVETTGRELRATFLRNHPRPAPNSALRRQVVERDDVGLSEVRKHRAPKGALRLPAGSVIREIFEVRKHRAPKGALRLNPVVFVGKQLLSQKAPSATRCIKTQVWLPK